TAAAHAPRARPRARRGLRRRALPQPGAPRRAGGASARARREALHGARAVARLPDARALEIQAARLRAADLLALRADLRPPAAALAQRSRARGRGPRARRADPAEPGERPPPRAVRAARAARAHPALRASASRLGRGRADRAAVLPLPPPPGCHP